MLAYWFAARGGWLKRLLAVSAILALVPMGNHLFVLENWSYYARWFYMPTLMMVLATAIVPKLGIRSHYLTQAETPGPVFSKLVPKQSQTS